ncbi:MAG: hypothetical protein ACYDAL_04190 [Candidatus Dormibacteraceae bacterium]
MRELAECSVHARSDLKALLPSQYRLKGYSTHISVDIPDEIATKVAGLYASTFAPAMMLMLDQPISPGLLIRPRPGRLELGGEFVDGVQLMAAVIFAVGSVLACTIGARGQGVHSLPQQLRVALQPDDRRFGWFVGRAAFGDDLYLHGRSTALPLATGGTVIAQEQLRGAWASAREILLTVLTEEELSAVDLMVTGNLSLPCENPSGSEELSGWSPPPSAFGAVLKPHRRPGFELAPVMVTWDVNVFLIVNEERTRRAFACVPRDHLNQFVTQLHRGDLDRGIGAYLGQPPRGRKLHKHAQTNFPGLYDELGTRINLLPRERPPMRPKFRWIRQLFQPAA